MNIPSQLELCLTFWVHPLTGHLYKRDRRNPLDGPKTLIPPRSETIRFRRRTLSIRRVLWCIHYGKYPPPGVKVRVIDGDPDNLRPDNLELTSTPRSESDALSAPHNSGNGRGRRQPTLGGCLRRNSPAARLPMDPAMVCDYFRYDRHTKSLYRVPPPPTSYAAIHGHYCRDLTNPVGYLANGRLMTSVNRRKYLVADLAYALHHKQWPPYNTYTTTRADPGDMSPENLILRRTSDFKRGPYPNFLIT